MHNEGTIHQHNNIEIIITIIKAVQNIQNKNNRTFMQNGPTV